MMNDFVSQAHNCFPGHFGVPVPDFLGDCSSSFTNLLYIAFNCINRLLAENKLLIGNSGNITLNLLHRGEDFGKVQSGGPSGHAYCTSARMVSRMSGWRDLRMTRSTLW